MSSDLNTPPSTHPSWVLPGVNHSERTSKLCGALWCPIRLRGCWARGCSDSQAAHSAMPSRTLIDWLFCCVSAKTDWRATILLVSSSSNPVSCPACDIVPSPECNFLCLPTRLRAPVKQVIEEWRGPLSLMRWPDVSWGLRAETFSPAFLLSSAATN